jgi:U3 small nucleolar RNA-associated protein 6
MQVPTQHEMQGIVKKRTALESALVRRAPRTADFLAYVAYEARLEALRRKRVARLRAPFLLPLSVVLEADGDLAKRGPPSVGEYALVRRQFAVFERALKKFGVDVAL